MKCIYSQLLAGLLFFSCIPPLWSSDRPCDTRLLIENKSGWDITLFYTTVVGGQMELELNRDVKLKELDTCLDKIATMSFERRGKLWGRYASKVSLDAQLQLLKAQLHAQHNKDGVITIDSTLTEWKLSASWEGAVRGSLVMPEEVWEEKESVQSKPQIPMPAQKPMPVKKHRIILVSLSDVRKGKLGANYAQKVQDIVDADYTHAEKRGKVNLKTQLMREFSEITIAQKTKDIGDTLLPIKISSEDARNSIDRLARVLNKYRTAGWIK